MLSGNLCSFFRSNPARQRVIPGEEASFLPLRETPLLSFFTASRRKRESLAAGQRLLRLQPDEWKARLHFLSQTVVHGTVDLAEVEQQQPFKDFILEVDSSPGTAGSPLVCGCIVETAGSH